MVEKTTDTAPARSDGAKCVRCRHYYITYDPRFPYGCRAMGIKSKVVPQREVEQASGMDCQTFNPRQKVPG